jgi:hypothetical protein
MAQIPSRFMDLVQQLNANEQPRRATVRNVLKLFNYERRGARVAAEIEQALDQAGLATVPPFSEANIDDYLQFVLKPVSMPNRATAGATTDGVSLRNDVMPSSMIALDHSQTDLPRETIRSESEANEQPIVGGQTTAQNEAVETVLRRLEEGEIFVPSYQRDLMNGTKVRRVYLLNQSSTD